MSLPKTSFRALIAGSLLSAFGLSGSAQQTTPGQTLPGPDPLPITPRLVLNEVLFDPIGAAGSDGTWQWVELYAKQATSTSGYELRDASGQLLVALPSISLPANSYALVLFGPRDATLENFDPYLGPVSITTGSGFADHLGVTQGGVQLARNGNVKDAVYWGTSAGAQPFVDLSFASGTPTREGDSIGRNSRSGYTGNTQDWSIGGGANANGPTPGTKNQVELPSEQDVVLHADNLLNTLFASLSRSFEQVGWLQVLDTAPTVLSITGSGTDDTLTAVVHHSFDLLIDHTPVTLAGEVTTTFDCTRTAGATAESWHVAGSLVSGDGLWGLHVDSSRNSSGAQALTSSLSYWTDFTWTHLGTDYSSSVSGGYSETRTSADTFQGNDIRSGTDWGNAGIKTGVNTWTRTQLGDGHYEVVSDVERSWPSLLPKPGYDQSWASGQVETLHEHVEYVSDGMGMPSGSVHAYSQVVDGYVIAELQPGEQGTISWTETDLGGGQVAFSMSSIYPLQDGGGWSYDFEVFTEGTTTTFGDKTLSTGCGGVRMDGYTLATIDFAIDPPLGDGPSLWDRVTDFGTTTVTCVAGGVGAQMAAISTNGKKAAIKMIGKAAAKKAIPVVGWVCTAGCALKACGDQIWGY